MKDIISEEEMKKRDELDDDPDYEFPEEESSCNLCELHRRAYIKIPEVICCPHCGTAQPPHILNPKSCFKMDWEVVGEGNFYEPEHKIGKYPVDTCGECGNKYALMPEKVIWNANHDVYYTGGRVYLYDSDQEAELFKKVEKKVTEKLENWVERYKSGEKLDPIYPALWIRRAIQQCIATFLFEKGLKK